MKTVVEWGVVKGKLRKNRPCGVSGQVVMPSRVAAKHMASHLYFVMSQGENLVDYALDKNTPRSIIWGPEDEFWIAVSLLDGKDRGAYSGIVEREYALRQTTREATR